MERGERLAGEHGGGQVSSGTSGTSGTSSAPGARVERAERVSASTSRGAESELRIERSLPLSVTAKARGVWDVLCGIAESRGSRRFEITYRDLLGAVGVSDRTLDDAISLFEGLGLLKVTSRKGDTRGNEYEILEREEDGRTPQKAIAAILRSAAHKIGGEGTISDQVALGQLARLAGSINRIVSDVG